MGRKAISHERALEYSISKADQADQGYIEDLNELNGLDLDID